MKYNPLLRIIEVIVLVGIAIAFISPLFAPQEDSSFSVPNLQPSVKA
jgi:hypothetical protein